MSDSAETASFETLPDAAAQPVAASAGPTWAPASGSQASTTAADHPELLVGGAFVGGVILATILKRLAG